MSGWTEQEDTVDARDGARDAVVDMARTLALYMDSYIIKEPRAFEYLEQEAAGHLGTRTIRIDHALSNAAHTLASMKRFERYSTGSIEVFDEETSLELSWDGATNDSRLRLVVDPLDGSSFLKGLGLGAVSVLAYLPGRKGTGRKWQLSSGAVALNTGYVFSYRIQAISTQEAAQGIVRAAIKVRRFRTTPRPDPNSLDLPEWADLPIDFDERGEAAQPRAMMVSCAASQERRNNADKLVSAFPHDFEVNVAGNLSVFGALLGVTSIVIDPEPATMHDGNYLFLLAAQGWSVFNAHTGQRVPLFELANSSCTPLITKDKRIPPVVAVRNEALAHDWLASIRENPVLIPEPSPAAIESEIASE